MPATVTPIAEADLAEIGQFLEMNLNARIKARDWIASVSHPWSEQRPNFGMQLRDEGRLVGVFCAIYSTQTIGGRVEQFCNPHSWCVQQEYRNHGIGLVLALARQPGYHFTMLTPNPKVAEIFRHLGFRDLAEGISVFPNFPSLARLLGAPHATGDPVEIAALLPAAVRRDYELHRGIPWLAFVAIGPAEGACLVVYKRARWKRLPCARIIHVSDPAVLDQHLSALRHHLLMRHGLLVSRVESRFLASLPTGSFRQQRTQAKLFKSRTLTDSQITDLYSELASLDV
jgi:hypothetical protein